MEQIPPSFVNYIHEALACQAIGLTIATTMYGITILQMYFYFRWYHDDRLWIKLLVAFLGVLDTLSTIFMAHADYINTVTNFAEPFKAIKLVWSFSGIEILAVVTAFVVQLYFAHRIWALSRGNYLLVGSILFFSFVGLVLGVVVTALLITIGHDSVLYISSRNIRVVCAASDACMAACDFLITGGLCWYLHGGRSGRKGFNSVIDKLMIYAINRGALTGVCQLLHLVTLYCLPGRFIFVPFTMIECKLYVNVLLATLNVRRSLSDDSLVEPTSILTGSLRPTPPGSGDIVQCPYDKGIGTVPSMEFAIASRLEEREMKTTSSLEAVVV
ncbi:hypothetical protein OH77DRAFT_1422963 [Trametes cingulata]|nr:hypothetical protein OH77DRAFT_1422963 [Trametes cingulata]